MLSLTYHLDWAKQLVDSSQQLFLLSSLLLSPKHTIICSSKSCFSILPFSYCLVFFSGLIGPITVSRKHRLCSEEINLPVFKIFESLF